MTPRALTAEEFWRLLQGLQRPSALVELALFAGCLLLAWALVRLLRGSQPQPGSVWFGEGIVDGVLFPVAALVTAWLARWLLQTQWPELPLAVFKLVVPVLVSLVAIRLTVRVLHKSFPTSAVMRR